MNRIDAFFTMFSLLIVWLCCIWLLPTVVMMFVYAGIAAWSVGKFIGNVPRRLAKETDRDFLEGMAKVADEQHAILESTMQMCGRLIAQVNARQAIIDQLMFEYCPDEMTPEQIGRYETSIRAVSQQQEDEIERALRH